MCAMALGIFGLIALWYCAPFTSFLPDYWYIPVAILTFAIIAQITRRWILPKSAALCLDAMHGMLADETRPSFNSL